MTKSISANGRNALGKGATGENVGKRYRRKPLPGASTLSISPGVQPADPAVKVAPDAGLTAEITELLKPHPHITAKVVGHGDGWWTSWELTDTNTGTSDIVYIDPTVGRTREEIGNAIEWIAGHNASAALEGEITELLKPHPHITAKVVGHGDGWWTSWELTDTNTGTSDTVYIDPTAGHTREEIGNAVEWIAGHNASTSLTAEIAELLKPHPHITAKVVGHGDGWWTGWELKNTNTGTSDTVYVDPTEPNTRQDLDSALEQLIG